MPGCMFMYAASHVYRGWQIELFLEFTRHEQKFEKMCSEEAHVSNSIAGNNGMAGTGR